MKILKKMIKECEETSWSKTIVLDLEYTHKWETWRILVKDYKDEFYDIILKQLRVAVRNAYVEKKLSA